MSIQQLEAFVQLKKLVEDQFKKSHGDCQLAIEDWKGQEIKNLQEALRDAVGGYVSEKWFYTHIKNRENQKLPREDMLNLLAQYTGFESWKSYLEAQAPASKAAKPSSLNQKKGILLLLGVTLLGIVGLFLFFNKNQNTAVAQNYKLELCFIDEDTKQPIEVEAEVQILHEEESSEYFQTTSACASLESKKARVQLLIKAPYYKDKKIERRLLDVAHEEQIPLKKDDYALMLHYFSTKNLEDWEKRRAQLDELLHEELRCVQVMGENEMGVQLMNKQEFIDRMTLPINSLKNIEILNTEYQDGKIWILRFQVQSTKQ